MPTQDLILILRFTISLSHKKCFVLKMLDDVIVCDFRFGLLPTKNLGYAYVARQYFFLRPESHDQVFSTIFLHQSCERSRKLMFHYCGHLSAILFHNRVRMKIKVQKVLLSSCEEIEPSSILPASFLKAAVLNDEN